MLAQLSSHEASAQLRPALNSQTAKEQALERVLYDQPSFRFALNEDAMATEKLAEGIRAFAVDTRKLEVLMQQAAA